MKSVVRIAAVAALAFTAASASAEEFVLVIKETPGGFAARTDPKRADAYWAAWGGYGKSLADAGIMRGGHALQPGDGAGSQVSGYFVIDVADIAAARAWAAKAPRLEGATAEARAILPMMAGR